MYYCPVYFSALSNKVNDDRLILQTSPYINPVNGIFFHYNVCMVTALLIRLEQTFSYSFTGFMCFRLEVDYFISNAQNTMMAGRNKVGLLQLPSRVSGDIQISNR